MAIYYIPFGIQTYIPVTTEDIKPRSFYKLCIRNQKTIKAIEAVMSAKADGVMVKKMVRAKVVMPTSGKVFFVDSTGGVIAENDGEFRINAEDLENILMSYIKENNIQRGEGDVLH